MCEDCLLQSLRLSAQLIFMTASDTLVLVTGFLVFAKFHKGGGNASLRMATSAAS